MKHRLLSFLLCVTVMASTIAGAMAVSVHFAKADLPSDSNTAYIGDLLDHIRELWPDAASETVINTFEAVVDDWLGEGSNIHNFACAYVHGDQIILSLYQHNNYQDYGNTLYSFYGNFNRSGIAYRQTYDSTRSYFYCRGNLYCNGTSLLRSWYPQSNQALWHDGVQYWTTNSNESMDNRYLCFPNNYDLNVSGVNIYVSNYSIYRGKPECIPSYTYGPTLFTGRSTPPILDFTFFKFNPILIISS